MNVLQGRHGHGFTLEGGDGLHRGTGTGEAAIALLSSIKNAEVLAFGQAEQCCGFGGTFSVTFPHISGKMGTLKLDHVLEQHPDLLISGDMSCLMHLSGLATTQ